MEATWLPWWLNKEHPPPDDERAQAVWVLGQWQFIPFAFGRTPLRRRCRTREEAHAEASGYEQAMRQAQTAAQKAEQTGQTADSQRIRAHIESREAAYRMIDRTADGDCPQGFRIFAIGGEEDDACVVLEPNGWLLKEAQPTYGDAFELTLREAACASDLDDGP